jgi:hypothetical protein
VLIDHEPTVVPEVDSPDHDPNEEDGSEEEGPKGREVEVYVPGKSTFAQTVSGRRSRWGICKRADHWGL